MPRQKIVGVCSVEDCDRQLKTKGLCQKHYMRQYLYGRTHLIRTGDRRSHPLYHLWFERKQDGLLSLDWMDFWAFSAFVGERPSPDHYLIRPDQKQPYGPANFEWRQKLRRMEGETKKAWWARKWASRRDANPGMERQRELRRKYGVTPQEYEALKAAQQNKCAICGQEERAFDGKTGAIRRLAVDHCHNTKRVRGLLCFRCNSTIGRIGEDLQLVDAIRAYLTRQVT